ncbi:hypothetical protein [Shewanella waksmanii]|uniref:hypothetical protein n=1 Tax=Shewanella waksmanii TaxID=213783 RepID=UPI0037353FEE
MRLPVVASFVAAATLLTACAATPPRVAQEKTVEIEGKTIKFGGQYDEKKNELKLTVNGDTLMQGRFPPYTPTQNFNAKYQDIHIKSACYFGSVLGNQGGAFGAIAGAIQASKSSSADKCEIIVAGDTVETLYF